MSEKYVPWVAQSKCQWLPPPLDDSTLCSGLIKNAANLQFKPARTEARFPAGGSSRNLVISWLQMASLGQQLYKGKWGWWWSACSGIYMRKRQEDKGEKILEKNQTTEVCPAEIQLGVCVRESSKILQSPENQSQEGVIHSEGWAPCSAAACHWGSWRLGLEKQKEETEAASESFPWRCLLFFFFFSPLVLTLFFWLPGCCCGLKASEQTWLCQVYRKMSTAKPVPLMRLALPLVFFSPYSFKNHCD